MPFKTFNEMIKSYALKIVKRGEEAKLEDKTFIQEVGECAVFATPINWVEGGKLDFVIRILPATSNESLYCLKSDFSEN